MKKIIAVLMITVIIISLFVITSVPETTASPTIPSGFSVVKEFDDIEAFQFGYPQTNYPYLVNDLVNEIYRFEPGALDGATHLQFHVFMTLTGSGHPFDFLEFSLSKKGLVKVPEIPPNYPPTPDPNAIWSMMTMPWSNIDITIIIDLRNKNVDGMAFAGFASRERYITITDMVALETLPTPPSPETTILTEPSTNEETKSETPTTGLSNEKGDINGDGLVDIEDLLLLKKHILKIDIIKDETLNAADFNGDGNVDVEDLLLIKKFILELIDKF